MDMSEIPVLTKVVHKTTTPAVDMEALVMQVKQTLLPEIAQLVASQLAEKNAHSLASEEQSLAEHAQALKHDLLVQAQSQIGDSIQSVEQAFTEAMGNISKQQLQTFQTSVDTSVQAKILAVEERLAQLGEVQQQALANVEQTIRDNVEHASAQWLGESLSPMMASQQTQLEARVQALQAQLEQALVTHIQQLEASGKQALTASQETAMSELVADYKKTLQQVFDALNAEQMTAFRQSMQAELVSSETVLQEKVTAIVATQLQAMEAEMNKRLKSRILEVLQGIKFVMPSI